MKAYTLKRIMLQLTFLLLSSQIFSQTIILNSKQDTGICFTINQGRFLLKESIKVAELTEKNSLYEKLVVNKNKEIAKQRAVIINDSLSKLDLFSANKKTEEQSALKDGKIKILTDSNKEKDKTIVRQKIYKWTAIILETFVSGYITYLYVKK